MININRSILYEYAPEELQKLLDTSNSYSDLLRTVGLNPKGKNPETLKKIIKEYNLDESQLNINRKKLLAQCANLTHSKCNIKIEDILAGKHPHYQTSRILKKLIEAGYKDNKCEICDIELWQNKPISFQLHHKDGNRNNNSLENLQILCPNCHSQTETFAGKNTTKHKLKREKKLNKIKNNIRKLPPISREELKNLIRTIPFTEIGKLFEVKDNSIRKWCDRYNLPRRKVDIKSISDEEWEHI